MDQIDATVIFGPGLRCAPMGPYVTLHPAGGPGGMATMFDHFGPTLTKDWPACSCPDAAIAVDALVVYGHDQLPCEVRA
jgi:carnitine 3-dehydrogenase